MSMGTLFIDDDIHRYKALVEEDPLRATEIIPIFSASGLRKFLDSEFLLHAISLDYDMPGTGLVYPRLLKTLAHAIHDQRPLIIIHSSRRGSDKWQKDCPFIEELMEEIQDMFDITPVRCRYSDEQEKEWAKLWLSLL